MSAPGRGRSQWVFVGLCCLSFLLEQATLLAAEEHPPGEQAVGDVTLPLMARSRVRQDDGSWRVVELPMPWKAHETAILICDMWNDHYCRAAASRVAEMAPHMNQLIKTARKQGVLIIHSPSGCMDRYADTPQRKLAQQAPPVKTKIPLEGWCYLNREHEDALPIDDSVPCEDVEPRPAVRMFNRQIATLEIEEGDAITDSAEAYYLIEQRKIKNVIVMGVHTNMCVLGRPFGIRQMVYQGKNVALLRDMTDSMYNPSMKPQVSHFRGTELVTEHIEKYWCPTITSTDFTGKAAFRFAGDQRPHVALLAGGEEYQANASLPQLAHELRDRYDLSCEVLHGRGEAENYTVPGLDGLKRTDQLVLFLRRRPLPKGQLDHIRNYLKAGKPIVAIRTASHGFDPKMLAAGQDAWPTFDRDVLGCEYGGHGPDECDVAIVPEAARHPILKNVSPQTWHTSSSLYAVTPLRDDVTVLLRGSFEKMTGPMAWTRLFGESRVFYTSLGHPDDFRQAPFRQLLVNAIFWGMDEETPDPRR